MADKTTVHIGENSPEEVAYKLFTQIASVEGIVFYQNPSDGKKTADRDWILRTYSEALYAVKNPGAKA